MQLVTAYGASPIRRELPFEHRSQARSSGFLQMNEGQRFPSHGKARMAVSFRKHNLEIPAKLFRTQQGLAKCSEAGYASVFVDCVLVSRFPPKDETKPVDDCIPRRPVDRRKRRLIDYGTPASLEFRQDRAEGTEHFPHG